jgi:hypothetical protein
MNLLIHVLQSKSYLDPQIPRKLEKGHKIGIIGVTKRTY